MASMSLRARAILVIVLVTLSASWTNGETWAWPDGEKGASGSGTRADSRNFSPASPAASVTGSRYQNDFSPGRQRYEITDPDSDDFTLPHPEDFGGGVNSVPRPPPNYPLRPPLRPDVPGPGFVPGVTSRPPLPPPGLPSPGSFRPPGSDRLDPTDVSKCKCVHAFNCESNALQFGSCDVGKRYCCTKENTRGPRGPGAAGGSPYRGPAILTGPGGPTGIIGPGPIKGNRPSSYPGLGDRPYSYGNPSDRYSAQGILVGPRPTYYTPGPDFNRRPGYSPINEIYNSNRGPYNGPYRDYDNYNRG